ncbi:MAG: Hcp family type VI secretion system effector [Gammaproteobacteria bacterium]
MAQGDMFLKIESARQGPIKGEAQDDNHQDEIDVVSWSWGMRAQTAMSGGGASGKSTLNELRIVKRVDRASTGLMAAMRNNDLIKKAVLTVRKAGGTALEYFKVTIQSGRVTLLEVQSGEPAMEAELVENLSLAFEKISVEYVPQGADGQARGGMVFETETGTN